MHIFKNGTQRLAVVLATFSLMSSFAALASGICPDPATAHCDDAAPTCNFPGSQIGGNCQFNPGGAGGGAQAKGGCYDPGHSVNNCLPTPYDLECRNWHCVYNYGGPGYRCILSGGNTTYHIQTAQTGLNPCCRP